MRGLSFLLALAACGGAGQGPVPIALGEDGCALCRMIISEAPHAAQMRLDRSAVEKYDDLGCLIERLNKGATPIEMWVTDRSSGRWIDAASAVYVHAPDFQTPMASGLAAFASRAEADAFANKEKGKVLSFAEVRTVRRPK